MRPTASKKRSCRRFTPQQRRKRLSMGQAGKIGEEDARQKRTLSPPRPVPQEQWERYNSLAAIISEPAFAAYAPSRVALHLFFWHLHFFLQSGYPGTTVT